MSNLDLISLTNSLEQFKEDNEVSLISVLTNHICVTVIPGQDFNQDSFTINLEQPRIKNGRRLQINFTNILDHIFPNAQIARNISGGPDQSITQHVKPDFSVILSRAQFMVFIGVLNHIYNDRNITEQSLTGKSKDDLDEIRSRLSEQ